MAEITLVSPPLDLQIISSLHKTVIQILPLGPSLRSLFHLSEVRGISDTHLENGVKTGLSWSSLTHQMSMILPTRLWKTGSFPYLRCMAETGLVGFGFSLHFFLHRSGPENVRGSYQITVSLRKLTTWFLIMTRVTMLDIASVVVVSS